MLIRVRFDDGSKTTELDYDPSLGIDTFMGQLVSIYGNPDNILLVDYGGYEITSHDDIEDIKVVEISDANIVNNSYNRLHSPSNDETISNNNPTNTNFANNNEIDDWAQHLDLTNSTSASSNNNSINSATPTSCNINIENNEASISSFDDNVSSSNTLYNQTHIDAVKDVSYGQSLVRLVAIADVWVVLNNDYCTTIINSKNNEDVDLEENVAEEDEIIQPCYRIADTGINICARCTSFFDPSLITKETSTLCSYSCNSRKALKLGLGLFPNSLEILSKENESTIFNVNPSNIYLRRKLLNQAINLLPNLVNENYDDAINIGEAKKFMMQLKKGSELIYRYEDAALQKLARSVIDYELVNYYAQEFLEKNNDSQSAKKEEDVALLAGLLRWFKSDFFKWCNKPECTNKKCESCGSQKDMESLRTEAPNADEVVVGQAGRTEVYRCKVCQNIERFPRFTDPGHLLVTRRGRCGEWASAFCLICRSLNLDARWVLDFTDHVWVEVWLPSLRRFVHADPCENKFDTPLLYESGWNKNLEYVLSFSRYGVVESTPKYTRKLNKIITKRSLSINEKFVQDSIKKTDNELEMTFSASRRNSAVSNSSLVNLQFLSSGEKGFESLENNDISIMTMKRRKRLLSKELVRLTLLGKLKDEEFEGRISGSKEWKEDRGEIGTKVSILNFPIIDSSNFSATKSTTTTTEVNALGLGLGSSLSDEYILKCQELVISLIKLDWFSFSSTIILDTTSGMLTFNTSEIINSSFYMSPNEKHKLILKIFEADGKSEAFENMKVLLRTEKLIIFHCHDNFDQDLICSLLSKGFLSSRTKFIIDVVEETNDNNTAVVTMNYVFLGGCVHPDTVAFDTTDFLNPFINFLGMDTNLAWQNLHLNQVSILSSPSLINGVQVQYSLPSTTTPLNALSPLFASYNDNPTLKTLDLNNNFAGNSQISKIDIRCGALIDKIEITADHIFSCGGDGGDNKSFSFPLGSELVGFFGGTGGHLHNLGLIIRRSNNATKTATKTNLLSNTKKNEYISIDTLLEKMQQHNLFYHRLFSTGILLNIISNIFQNNEISVRRRSLHACATYAANITADTMNFRTVKKDNKFFKRTVESTLGGLELFLIRPIGFSTISNSHYYTNTNTIDFIWLKNYSNFLYELSLI